MAGEIEKYLLQNLDREIGDTKSAENYLSTVLFDLHSDFKKLRDSLVKITSPEKKRENLYYLNNLLSDWQLLSKSQSVFSPEGLKSAHRLRQRLKKIRKDLHHGEGSGSGSETTGPGTPPDSADQGILAKHSDTFRWSSRTVDRSKVYGLDDKERFQERLLVRKECKNGFKAFAVIGMAGIGKTTLCQLMFNNEKVKEHFLLRIWVCLSKQKEDDEDQRKEAVKRMLMCLGVDDEIIEKAGEDRDLGLERLIFALRSQLTGKRYLIVLDDAWSSEKCFEDLSSESSSYEQLAYGLPKGHGGTVVITTRSDELAKKMVGEENLHHLPILMDSEKEIARKMLEKEDLNHLGEEGVKEKMKDVLIHKESCWKIFKDSAEKDGIKFPDELMPLKDLIVEKCAGLPLAAKMMGEIMHENLKKKNPDSAITSPTTSS